MALLRDSDRDEIRNRLSAMTDEVKMVFFTLELDCQFCRETGMLLQELSDLSDKLSLEVYNLITDKDVAERYKVDKVPATLLLDREGRDCNIRFYGIPSGYEFATLLEDILMISSGDSGLAQETRDALKTLENDVHMQVFITPTCPYCPNSVRIAHQMAFESERVTGDMVEATEFPSLSQRFSVMAVPKTVINGNGSFEGMQPERMVLPRVLEAARG